MKKYLTLFLLFLVLYSCKKKDGPGYAGTIDTIGFIFYNHNDQPLFRNESNPHKNVEDLNFYYLDRNRQRVSLRHSRVLHSYGYDVVDMVHAFIADTLYVDICGLTVDTIVATSKEYENLTSFKELYYNGQSITVGTRGKIPLIKVTIDQNGNSLVEEVNVSN